MAALTALAAGNDASAEPDAVVLAGRQPIGDLVASDAQVAPGERVKVVADRFFHEEALDAVAVCAAGVPVGLVTRARLLLRLAKGLGADLWSRRPISAIADVEPLMCPENTPLDVAMQRALARPAATVYDEVIVTHGCGRYRGLLPVRDLALHQGLALARSIVAHEAAVARARDLEAVEALRARFLAHATHELRSPVNAIVAAAELIRMAADRGSLEGVSAKVPVLLRTATSLRGTVNNILDLSRLEAGRAEVTVATVELAPLLDEVASLAHLLAADKPIEIVAHAGAGLAVQTDRLKLRQILVNLAANAAKFTQRGRVAIRAGAAADGGVRVSVEDTGPGIRAEDLSRLFVAFGQLEDAQVKEHEGTGLGLVITRSLAALLGGRVEVRSTYGEGSTFTVLLPPFPPERPRT